MQNPWNSLEISKLIISASTPIIVAFIGFFLNRSIKQFDKRQWNNQKIIEKRLQIYDNIVPVLNDILCFHCYIGSWKETSARKIIEYKRLLDKEINVYSPLFPKELMNKYNAFIEQYYETNTGWGNDAKINSLYTRRKQYSKEWIDSDIDLFSQTYILQASQNKDIEHDYIAKKKEVYFDLVNCLGKSLEIMNNEVNDKIINPSINYNNN